MMFIGPIKFEPLPLSQIENMINQNHREAFNLLIQILNERPNYYSALILKAKCK